MGLCVCSVCDVGELWVDKQQVQRPTTNIRWKWYSYLRWLKDGGKTDANISDEGWDTKGQEEKVEGMVLSTTNIRWKWYSYVRWLKDGSKAGATIADEDEGAKWQEEQVEGMVSKVGGKY